WVAGSTSRVATRRRTPPPQRTGAPRGRGRPPRAARPERAAPPRKDEPRMPEKSPRVALRRHDRTVAEATGRGARSTAMETIGLVGVTARDLGASGLARFTWAKDERVARLSELAGALGVDEVVYLATCNRVELFYRRKATGEERDLRRAAWRALTGGEAGDGEAERTLRGWIGEGAV